MSTEPETKPLIWLTETPQTPPWSIAARVEVGRRLRLLQDGLSLGMPVSRPMPSIGPRCHELRVRDADANWRLVYRIDAEAVLIVAIWSKKTQVTPKAMIDLCKRRLNAFDNP